MLLESQSQEVGKQRELSVPTASTDGCGIISVAAMAKNTNSLKERRGSDSVRCSLSNRTCWET